MKLITNDPKDVYPEVDIDMTKPRASSWPEMQSRPELESTSLSQRCADDLVRRYEHRPWTLAGITLGLFALGAFLTSLCGGDEE